jgi:DUF1707 SHOCT-like domain
MAGPGDEGSARGRFRAARADREQAIEALKTAFTDERLAKDEFDLRVEQALAARTYAELAAVTSDLEVWPATAGPAATETPGVAARTLVRAARRSGVCLLAALAMVGVAALTHSERMAGLAILSLAVAVMAVSGLLGYGAVDAWQAHKK